MCFLAEKCHGQQENRDLLYGGDKKCGQRGEKYKMCKKKKLKKQQNIFAPKGEQKKYKAEGIYSGKGAVKLGTVMYRIDLGI